MSPPSMDHPIVCPRCFADLEEAGASWRCACGAEGTSVGGLTALYADHEAEAAAVAAAAARHLAAAKRTAEAVERDDAALPGWSRPRRERLLEGLHGYRDACATRWREVGLPLDDDGDTTRHDPDRGFPQTLRDWAWTDSPYGPWEDENAQALAQLAPHAGDELGRVLVLGAGAARLAADLHGLGAERTIALDLTPFPLLVFAGVQAGAPIDLWELPSVPSDASTVAVRWQPRASIPPEVVPVLADGLDPPFPMASFDTVVTPWFLDQIPRDHARLLTMIRHLLVPGGRWLFLGPLIYPVEVPPQRRLPLRELLALAEDQGFEVGEPTSERVHYLWSPVAAQGRVEVVHAFAARRLDGPAERPPPAWLARTDVPIPRFRTLEGVEHPVKRAIVEALDGRRSAADIAKKLIDDNGVPAAKALYGVQLTLRDLHLGGV